MDTGAYGSYPRRRRTYKKTLGRRYKRRANPVNQYTFRKTRVGRLTKTDLQLMKISYRDGVALNSAGNYQFISTAAQYVNLSAMLLASPEFVSRQTQYSYYMLNGISVKFTRKWLSPIAYGVTGTSPGFQQATYTLGLSALNVNFYPNLVNSVIGQPVQDADSSWLVSPYLEGGQGHYQPFPKNFTTGTNSNGLGVWNACSQAANIQGQLSIYSDQNLNSSNIPPLPTIWDIAVELYIQFCNNTGI